MNYICNMYSLEIILSNYAKIPPNLIYFSCNTIKALSAAHMVEKEILNEWHIDTHWQVCVIHNLHLALKCNLKKCNLKKMHVNAEQLMVADCIVKGMLFSLALWPDLGHK